MIPGAGIVNSTKKVGDVKEKIQFTPDVIIKVELSELVMRKDLKVIRSSNTIQSGLLSSKQNTSYKVESHHHHHHLF